ncbi:hypothetical protein AVEN_65832-1 [Araneus ventricosus]|uniref:Uncharacterized protein n=1 Tax=Araneus ventricosus TaxID=182803 RepID=A0A4Y2WWV2_ARAVE|nr:hypothetical protein AVEN_65832-1 [Araneus ventricosus]
MVVLYQDRKLFLLLQCLTTAFCANLRDILNRRDLDVRRDELGRDDLSRPGHSANVSGRVFHFHSSCESLQQCNNSFQSATVRKEKSVPPSFIHDGNNFDDTAKKSRQI